jgi:mono/diheme cytochrome c family protein
MLMPKAPRVTRHASRVVVAALAVTTMTACDWFTEFKSQPRIEPWEPVSQMDNDTTHAPRGNPQHSVPISGTAVAGYQVSYRPIAPTIDSMTPLANPVPASPASLENGRKQYTINCAVCHGFTGAGDGPATKYGMIPFPINNARGQSLSDGYIYGMIRNGRGAMPTYDRIEEGDRWDVVNYVRALQGRTPNTTGGTGYYGVPGQTGNALPGASRMAPTVPPPMWRPTAAGVPGAAAAPVQATPTDSAPGLTARPAAPNDSAATTRRTP